MKMILLLLVPIPKSIPDKPSFKEGAECSCMFFTEPECWLEKSDINTECKEMGWSCSLYFPPLVCVPIPNQIFVLFRNNSGTRNQANGCDVRWVIHGQSAIGIKSSHFLFKTIKPPTIKKTSLQSGTSFRKNMSFTGETFKLARTSLVARTRMSSIASSLRQHALLTGKLSCSCVYSFLLSWN